MTNRTSLVALVSLLTACARTNGPDGFYSGPLIPVQPAQACEASRATLQIRGDSVIFVPSEGTWVLQGATNADGTITADRSQVGVNKQVFETTFEARRTGDAVAGTYTTPKCRFRVALTRR